MDDTEVSVIVLSYHPVFDKEKKTLLSIIRQKGISCQIIIADDGSEDNHREDIVRLFEAHGFTNYQLVMNRENHGTIANLLSGLKEATGEYTKCISPGDYLAGETVLRDWVDELHRGKAEWSFSEAVFYTDEGGTEKQVLQPAFPIYVKPYLRDDTEKARWNYVVIDDIAYGCVMLGKTELITRYAEELAENGCRYAEDYMFRLMMFDGIPGSYYPRGTVFYESGTGISTGKSQKWTRILHDEYMIMSRIMLDLKVRDPFQAKMQEMVRRKITTIATVCVPGTFRRLVRWKLHPRIFAFDFAATEEWRKQCR